LGEIRRSFDYYETQSRKKTVERVILCGGSAKLKNLNRFLAGKLGIPVEHFGVFRNVETNKSVDVEQQIRKRTLPRCLLGFGASPIGILK
jgi:Tfp pilus assembly PilM family ATPase